MSRISQLSWVFSIISFICLIVARIAIGGWHHFLWLPLGFFLFLFSYPFFHDRKIILKFFTLKTTKHGMNMGTMILLVFGVLVFINILAIRHSMTWDFSMTQVNTLSSQSIQLLKSLDQPLKVYFFYKDGVEGNEDNRRQFRELIKKYQDQTDKIALDFVEVNTRPDLTTTFGVNKGSGVAFVEYKGQRNRVDKIEEQDLTYAIMKVVKSKERTIYFSTGHGEMSLNESKEAAGLGALGQLLQNNRYNIKELNLSTQNQIPAEAEAFVVAGPSSQFLDFEIQAIEAYLKKGGSVLVALESQKKSGIEKLLGKIHINIPHTVVLNVVDTQMGKGVNQGPTFAPEFSLTHPITKVFPAKEFVLFRFPTSIIVQDKTKGLEYTELVRTTDQTAAFDNFELSNQKPMKPETLGVAVEGSWTDNDKKMKLVVIGDAEFMANGLIFQNLNRDFVLNTMAYLVGEENMIAISPKEVIATKMSFSESTSSLYIWGVMIPIPLLLLGISLFLWSRRRYA